MHPVMAQCLAAQPFMPPMNSRQSINDDDLYLVNIRTRTIVGQHGAKSAVAAQARSQGYPVRPGQAMLTGMQLKSSGLVDLEAA